MADRQPLLYTCVIVLLRVAHTCRVKVMVDNTTLMLIGKLNGINCCQASFSQARKLKQEARLYRGVGGMDHLSWNTEICLSLIHCKELPSVWTALGLSPHVQYQQSSHNKPLNSTQTILGKAQGIFTDLVCFDRCCSICWFPMQQWVIICHVYNNMPRLQV